MLDGVDVNGNDTDNIDNWQREGDSADNWAFVGVIDTDGFFSAELRELRGKDFQQVLLFADDFTIGRTADPEPFTGDFNGDGELDVIDVDMLGAQIAAETPDLRFDVTHDSLVNGDDLTAWVKDLKRTWFGDADLNGEFNSSDMVQVFAAGRYETADDAGWAQGDWDASGLFNSSDMVAAFVDGGYEKGLRTAVNAAPEPASASLLLGCLIAILTRRRHLDP